MKLRDHESRAAVRKHLIDNGFVDAFASPGRPELWLKPGSPKLRYAVQRERTASQFGGCDRWHIIPYPEPSVCSPKKEDEFAWLE